MANKRDEGKGEQWRQEARGKGEARKALQAKSIGRVGGDIITCDSRARREGSPRSRARAMGHEIGFQAQRSIHPYKNQTSKSYDSLIQQYTDLQHMAE